MVRWLWIDAIPKDDCSNIMGDIRVIKLRHKDGSKIADHGGNKDKIIKLPSRLKLERGWLIMEMMIDMINLHVKIKYFA